MSNWYVDKPNAVSSSNTSAGSVESYGLQISTGSTYQDWSGYRTSLGYPMQYAQFYNSTITFPDTLDNYSYICIEYNVGNLSEGETTKYSKYLAYGFVFRDNASGSSNRYYYSVGSLETEVSGGGTHKIEIKSTVKTSYNRYKTGSYGAIRFDVGGWESEKIHSNDEDDEYTVYYNSGYITAVWLEE